MDFLPGELDRFRGIFNSLNPNNGYLSGEQARNIFLESGLDVSVLEKIWDLADMDKDGSMTFEEFSIAMKLIYESINGHPIPNSVPAGLLPRSGNFNGTTGVFSGYQSSPNPTQQTTGLRAQGADVFNWDIPLSDRFTYEHIFTKYTEDGRYVVGSQLDELFQSFSLSSDQIYAAWQLVDVRSEQKLNKDQLITFLHIVDSVENGASLPRQCPPNIISNFKLDSPQSTHSGTTLNKNTALADNYQGRVGANSATGRSPTFANGAKSKVSDEEEKLQKELAELERSIEEKKGEISRNTKATSNSTNARIKEQLDALYKFKQLELTNKKELVENMDGNSSQTTRQMQLDRRAIDELKMNLRNLKNQKQSLESHIQSTQQELDAVLKEIEVQKSK
ncbi:hypothetical protein K493DRAFT_317744 [Basidiobolus meristosporus CBS 931.73]|uniref:Endocytosis protein 3 n=1 Tax=Basidiobolus meristosporus CBS 931.73 TaxID=1314790 RepID=A0A1Y1XZF6_9FUNG|nr:hypothetical protein K493DRAFT_317744 [Basidiobolus meristosporus CBS 931.73]|eukprot:ORX90754.1 hypothetical protein K493DRAFT_317744 [Basidiobolus meristosporus CBS 931.73]